MNSYQWRSSTARKVQRSNSTQSPRHGRPNLSSIVASGTVASRVRFLENHPLPNHIPPRGSTPNHTCGESQGFGRRMTSRFGKPASRNGYPDKDPQFNTEHSFLGLHSIRTTHLHEHGLTDGGADRRNTGKTESFNLFERSGYSRASEIPNRGKNSSFDIPERSESGPMQPRGLVESPLKPHKATSWRRNEIESLEEIDGFGNYFKILTPSIFPTIASGISHSDMYSRDVKSRYDNTMKSDFSTLTTSTVRQQSVRDLFDEYRIERPLGLVPDGPPKQAPNHSNTLTYSNTTSPTLKKSGIRCHNCSWSNNESSNWCIKCKMVLRSVRHMDSLSLISPKGEPTNARSVFLETSRSNVLNEFEPLEKLSSQNSGKENQSTKLTKMHNGSAKPGPAPVPSSTQALCQVKRTSSQTTKFPSFNTAQSLAKSQMMSRNTTVAELPQLFKGSRTTTLVKDSPFLIADQILSGISGRCFPLMPQGDSVHCPEAQPRGDYCQEAKETAVDYESPGCRAKHEDHEPYRHYISCSGKTNHFLEETDLGYVADTSFAEDSSKSRPHSARSRIFKQGSSRYLGSGNLGISQQSLGSEYVECRGYPRTGHARHGSATSGTLGQCQHCIDDCQCTSCQNTHHSVRCCMNENHQGMVHHHHSPRERQFINPLDCPNFSSQSPVLSEKSPLASPARTVTPPDFQTLTTFLPSSEISQASINIQPPTNCNTREKPRSLPTSKPCMFLKEAAKSPTPPSWVSNPKLKTKSHTSIKHSKLQSERTRADTALDVELVLDPPFPFEEPPKLPPQPPCDFPSPDQNEESTMRAWVKSLSDSWHEHENNPNFKSPSNDQHRPIEKLPLSPSIRTPSRDSKTSTLASRKAPRNLSELLRLGEKNTVPLLNQKLIDHQEELRKIEKQCDDRLEVLARENSSRQNVPSKAVAWEDKKFKSVERETSTANSNHKVAAKKKSRWGLSLVDKKQTHPCCTDAPTTVQEHRLSEDTIVPCDDDPPAQKQFLSDDPIVDEKGNDIRKLSVPDALVEALVDSTTKIEEHECVWKTRFVVSQNDNGSQGTNKEGRNMPLQGVTVVVHMDGRDDVVIEADLRKGARVKTMVEERGCSMDSRDRFLVEKP
jgi:hypothetical protein